MVLLHVVTNDIQQANDIVVLLVEKKLILNALIQENVVLRRLDHKKEISSEKQILIMGKTKALLFNPIDRLLREKYGYNMPLLYSIPIVSMDFEQADQLIKETAAV
jgi:uncharacterized protein involved in tolerance to divalent cations